MNENNEFSANNALRCIALCTTDPLARTLALAELQESEDQARHMLSQTCWADDLVNLRYAVEDNYKNRKINHVRDIP